VTTHLVDEIEYADRLIILRRGRVMFDGSPKGLLEKGGKGDLLSTVIEMMGDSAGDVAGI